MFKRPKTALVFLSVAFGITSFFGHVPNTEAYGKTPWRFPRHQKPIEKIIGSCQTVMKKMNKKKSVKYSKPFGIHTIQVGGPNKKKHFVMKRNKRGGITVTLHETIIQKGQIGTGKQGIKIRQPKAHRNMFDTKRRHSRSCQFLPNGQVKFSWVITRNGQPNNYISQEAFWADGFSSQTMSLRQKANTVLRSYRIH